MNGNPLQGVLANLMNRLGGHTDSNAQMAISNQMLSMLPAVVNIVSNEAHSELHSKISTSFSDIVDIIKASASPRLREQLSSLFSSEQKSHMLPEEKMRLLTGMLPSLMDAVSRMDEATLATLNTKINAILPDVQKALNKERTTP